jgi:hypothetical protein
VRIVKDPKIAKDGFSTLYIEKYLNFLCAPCVLSAAGERKKPLSLAEDAEFAEKAPK